MLKYTHPNGMSANILQRRRIKNKVIGLNFQRNQVRESDLCSVHFPRFYIAHKKKITLIGNKFIFSKNS